MYIHPFVAGVLCTILVLAVWTIVYGFMLNRKNKGNDKDDKK